MSRLYSCIISSSGKRELVAVARQFAYAIQTTDDGIVFDVSGLERLMGKQDRVEQRILAAMQAANVSGCVAVADTVDTAVLLARQGGKQAKALNTPDRFSQLPLTDLTIEQDTLNVFNELGLHTAGDLLAVPHDELIGRYGRQFTDVIDVLEQKGRSLIMPNIKENRVSWSFELDNPVEDFEQLVFLLNHGLKRLFAQVDHAGFSTEHLCLKFKLRNKAEKPYEIKTSFPTLDRSFWLKLINLRAALDPPEASITAADVTAHFTKARPAQRGLYAVSRPEPENLLLTVNKLRKLVGEENVGVPVLLDQRAAEAFTLVKDGGIAAGSFGGISEKHSFSSNRAAKPPIIGFAYYRPPVRAEVLVRDKRLVFVKARHFAAHIVNYSGVWKGNSRWWDQPWRTLEWDIEVEGHGVYRLCKVRDEWFLTGEYD